MEQMETRKKECLLKLKELLFCNKGFYLILSINFFLHFFFSFFQLRKLRQNH